jgi:hypothetical protein
MKLEIDTVETRERLESKTDGRTARYYRVKEIVAQDADGQPVVIERRVIRVMPSQEIERLRRDRDRLAEELAIVEAEIALIEGAGSEPIGDPALEPIVERTP